MFKNTITILDKQSSILKNFYENPLNISSAWGDIDKIRIPSILKNIPPNVYGKILEIGLGGGKIFQELCKLNPKSFGIDLSLNALQSVKDGNKINANSKSLPFKNNCFEICIVADILEHVLDQELAPTIKEISRITKQFLILDSPYKDQIRSPIAKCMECQKEFNVYGHLRTFTKKKLRYLFSGNGFKYLSSETCGPVRRWRNKFILWCSRKLGRSYSNDYTTCPLCNGRNINPKRSFIHKILGKAIWTTHIFIDSLIPNVLKPRAEIIMVFEKKAS